MDGNYYTAYTYKLRSAGALPMSPGNFLVQTFGANKNEIKSYEATTTLPKTEDFVGASSDGSYISASFQRLPHLTSAGQQVFSGQTIGKTIFIDEDDIPGS
jgi:hypothetical protein